MLYEVVSLTDVENQALNKAGKSKLNPPCG